MRKFRANYLGALVLLGVAASAATSIEPAEMHVKDDSRDVAIEDLLQRRVIGGMNGIGLSISPDKRYVAYEMHRADVARDTYNVAWFVTETHPGGATVFVGDGGDPLLFRPRDDDGTTNGEWLSEVPVWSVNSQWIFYRRRVAGETQIWRSGRDGRIQERLTNNPADVESFVLSADGGRIFFGTDVTRVQLRDQTSSDYANGQLFNMSISWSTLRGAQIRPRYQQLGGKPLIWVYDLRAVKERRATERELVEYQQLTAHLEPYTRAVKQPLSRRSEAKVVARAKDGSSIAWLAPIDREKQGLLVPVQIFASEDEKAGVPLTCGSAACTGMIEYSAIRMSTLSGGLWWSEDGREIFFIKREGANYGRVALYAWHLRNNHIRKVMESTDAISNCQQGTGYAICLVESPTRPRSVVAISLTNGSMVTLYDPNPEFDKLRFGKVARLEWEDKSGNATFGYLIKPPDYDPARRYPLVVIGYRASMVLSGGTGEEYPAHLFAQEGLAVLVYDTPDPWDIFATSGNALEAGLRMWDKDLFDATAAVSLIEAAVDRLDKEGLVDPRRVGITGFSTGASQASYALVNSRRFAAAAVSGVPWNRIGYYLSGGGSSFRSILRKMGFGPAGTRDDRSWRALSIGMNAESIDTPLLINASDNEYHPAMEAVVALHEAGKPVEMYVYADEYHVKWHPAHRATIWSRNIDWFKFWLQNLKDQRRSSDEQYLRWQALKKLAAPSASGHDSAIRLHE